MPKRGTFLLIVQTAVLANGTSVASRPELAEKYRDECSATGVLRLMADAVEAGQHIPDDLSAADAANAFCRYRLRHLRDAEEASGTRMERPAWLMEG